MLNGRPSKPPGTGSAVPDLWLSPVDAKEVTAGNALRDFPWAQRFAGVFAQNLIADPSFCLGQKC